MNLIRLENKLNYDIGFHWWKKYIASAFWSNVSMPVNLSITVITALTTAQATTNNLLPQNVFISVSIVALILTTINTFFRPNAHMTICMKILQDWTEFGNRFEMIYYQSSDDEKLANYRMLYEEIQRYKNNDSPENQNFFTDLLHILARMTCIQNKEKWLDLDGSMTTANSIAASSSISMSNVSVISVQNSQLAV